MLAGPFATMLLGDLGADVIKVEPPDGDETRAWGPPWWGDPLERRSASMLGTDWISTLDGIPLPPSPIRIGGEALVARRPPPLLGEHTDEVLRELKGAR